MPRHFFDISAVAWHLKRVPQFSGIQRAVTLMIERSLPLLERDSTYLSFFDKATGRYRAMQASAFAPGELTDADALRAALGYGRPESGVHPALKRYQDRPAKLWFHRSVLDASAMLGRERPFRRNNITLEDWRTHRKGSGTGRARVPTEAFEGLARGGDRLVLLDGTFTVSRAEAAFRAAREAGLSVHMMVHDLIPVVMPEVSSDLAALNFHDWLRRSGDYATHYLANSEATKADLAKFLTTYGVGTGITVVPFAQQALPARSAGPGGPLIERVDASAYPALAGAAGIDGRVRSVAAQPYVLCVGTMEIRKNIWRTATAWDRMRRMEGIDLPKLVFAGRSGWLKQDFDDLLAGTGNLGGWVTVLETPSDAELAYLYRNCRFTIMPSLYEGWGLPVGESLSYGKTAVVSDSTSLPEVGGDLVEYCDPRSTDSIVAACLRLIADPARRLALEDRIRSARLRRWDDVARDLVRVIG